MGGLVDAFIGQYRGKSHPGKLCFVLGVVLLFWVRIFHPRKIILSMKSTKFLFRAFRRLAAIFRFMVPLKSSEVWC
jgi:hypothetical protein